MRFGSVFSGIEAASVAWEPLGWQCKFVAEIEPFPAAVLAERYPHVPNVGDVTALCVADLPHIDVLVGGSPCQAFSIAGKRLSLGDTRGNLTLTFTVLAHELQDKHGKITVVWENVPGVLNTEDNAFGCFLGALVGGRDALPCPRGFERWPDHGMVAGPRGRAVWRVLDAQWFGLAQRRERVFLVASLGDNGIDPAAVLFESQGMQGDRPACVEERARASARSARAARPKSIWAALAQAFRAGAPTGNAQRTSARGDVSPTLPARTTAGGGSGLTSNATADSYPLNDLDGVSHSLSASGTASGYMDASVETYIAHAVTASDGGISGKDGGYGLIAHTLTGEGHDASEDGTGRGTPLVAVPRPVCFSSKDDGRDITYDLAPTMRAMQNDVSWANGGGQLAVTCAIPLQVNGASGSNGCGTGQAGDPMLTLQAGVQHGVAIAFDTTQITSAENRSNPRPGDPCPTLVSDMHAAPAVAFNIYPLAGQGTLIDAAPTDVSTSVGATTHGSMTDRGTRVVQPAAVAFSMRTRDGDPQAEMDGDGEISSAQRAADGGSTRPFLASTDVRRLTVVECERLQGFSDNWTLIHGDWRPRKPEDRAETIRYLMETHGLGGNEAAVLADCPDGPRYRALGNSMATRCMAWIGRRIQDQCEL